MKGNREKREEKKSERGRGRSKIWMKAKGQKTSVREQRNRRKWEYGIGKNANRRTRRKMIEKCHANRKKMKERKPQSRKDERKVTTLITLITSDEGPPGVTCATPLQVSRFRACYMMPSLIIRFGYCYRYALRERAGEDGGEGER